MRDVPSFLVNHPTHIQRLPVHKRHPGHDFCFSLEAANHFLLRVPRRPDPIRLGVGRRVEDKRLLVTPHDFLFEVLRLLLEPADKGKTVFTVLVRQAILP